ncbi:MAG: hypothetical protein SGPRY_007633, partial [Prymnesium sp.]
MLPPTRRDAAALLSQWTAPALVNHLLTDASGDSHRIRRRDAIHQLMNLLPLLPDEEQRTVLRQLRQLAGQAVYNLHIFTSQLDLISTLLSRLHPSTPHPPSPYVREELLELLATLGSHRASTHQLRALFGLVRSGLHRVSGGDRLAPPKIEPATVSLSRPPPAAMKSFSFIPSNQDAMQSYSPPFPPPSLGGAPTSSFPPPSPEVLLGLLLRWCNTHANEEGVGSEQTLAPRRYFDLDDRGGGIVLPPSLGVELVTKPAFTLSLWLRLEPVSSNRTELICSLTEKRDEMEAGFEISLQRQTGQVSICVFTPSKSKGGGWLGLRGERAPQSMGCTSEKVWIQGVDLRSREWHHLVLCFRKGQGMGSLRSRHEAFGFLDGKRLQTTPCAFPSLLTQERAAESAHLSSPTPGRTPIYFVVGLTEGAREGIVGQLGTIAWLKGCPADAEAASLFAAGPNCADLDGALLSASSAAGYLTGRSSASVLAAYDASICTGGRCDPICGSRHGSASLLDGTRVIHPLDMRAALGGALPLLPLIDETISTISTQVGMPALSEGDNPTLTNEYGGLVLSKVVHLLTALLRGPHIYVVEVARTGAIGMLGHLLGSCPPSFVTPDLLAAMCSLEASLAAHAELSDQVLIHIFLQLQLWARARTAVVPPLLRQLYRLASERPEQWARIEGACRLLDGMQDEFPCRDASLADSQEAVGEAEAEMDILWKLALEAIAAAAHTEFGLPPAQLRYIIYNVLRSGSHRQGESVSFTLSALQLDARERTLKLLGRVLLLATGSADGGGAGLGVETRLAAAVRWVQSSSWAKCGWAWLTPILNSGPAAEGLMEEPSVRKAQDFIAEHISLQAVAALATYPLAEMKAVASRLIVNGTLSPLSITTTTEAFGFALACSKQLPHACLTESNPTRLISSLTRRRPQDESAHRFVNAPALIPLLSVCSNSSVELQHSMLLAICLWLRRSQSNSNHTMLTAQRGWQMHVCHMLNGSGGPDGTSHALCLQLLSEHTVAAMMMGEDSWAEVVRTVAFLEMYTVEPV